MVLIMTNTERNNLADILVQMKIEDAFIYAKENNIDPEVVLSILIQEAVTQNVFTRLVNEH